MTPEKRYLHDNQFRTLVDWMEKFIAEAQFSPSEMREAAVLACIRYEMRRPMPSYIEYPPLAGQEGRKS